MGWGGKVRFPQIHCSVRAMFFMVRLGAHRVAPRRRMIAPCRAWGTRRQDGMGTDGQVPPDPVLRVPHALHGSLKACAPRFPCGSCSWMLLG